METPLIRYNLKDRGRRYRGKERNFNIASIVGAINGPETQERVKNRDMHGYYGHWTRIKYGMIPNEGIMDGGDVVPRVIPAFVTTYLHAFPDGTVEHRAEFLDAGPGQVAAKLNSSKIGGFSSAIQENSAQFFGFDYVAEPNYTTNRGYALDSAGGMTLDEVDDAIRDEQLHAMAAILDSISSERERVADVIERLALENEQLLSMLASSGKSLPTMDEAGVSPLMVPIEPAERLRRATQRFQSSPQMTFLPPPVESSPEEPADVRQRETLVSRFLNR